MHTKAFPYIGLLGLFWGTNIVASRFGVVELDPLLYISLRISVAAICMLLILLIQRRTWPADLTLWGHALISGVIGVSIPMSLFIFSLQYQSSGVTSIFVTTGPALMVIAAHFFLPDEKMTRNKAVGVLLALIGSLFLVIRGETGLAGVGQASLLGFIFVFTALSFDVLNTMFVRKRMRDMDPVMVTAIRLCVGSVLTTAVALLFSDFSFTTISVSGYISIIYAGLVGALAGQFLAFYVIGRFGATAYSLTTYVIPVVATIFGVLLLDEIVTWGMLVGVVLIGGGITLINRQVDTNAVRLKQAEYGEVGS
ncbi:MAG: DMT family transporter [Chloroflexota bacterium]